MTEPLAPADTPRAEPMHVPSTRGIELASSERRIALVIGNGGYKDGPLKNPPNDARLMADVLQGFGFEVTLGIDLDLDAMRRAIRSFGRALQHGGVGLFYYAGHGMQVQGLNYLIPVGAELLSEDDVSVESINVDDVLAKMSGARNRLNVVVLDACRNNPFERSFRGTAAGLAQMKAPTGTLIAYATAPGSVASDGKGEHGLYTSVLSEEMRVPGVQIEDVFKAVREHVYTQSSGLQVPWESSSLMGNFYFNLEGVDGAQPRQLGTTQNIAHTESASHPAKYIVGGLGLASLAAGAVLGVMAIKTKDKAEALCPERTSCSADAVSKSKSAMLQANLSNVGLGLGIVGLGIATYLLFTQDKPARADAQARARLEPVLAPSIAALTLSGVF